MKTTAQLIDDLIKLAFAEDIGDGDHTTLCCIPETAMGKSQLIIKENGILAGVDMAKRIFHDFDPELRINVFINDGAEVKKGDIAFKVEGGLKEAILECKEKKVRAIDLEPRKGADNLNIAFLHPKFTQGVLTELCEE